MKSKNQIDIKIVLFTMLTALFSPLALAGNVKHNNVTLYRVSAWGTSTIVQVHGTKINPANCEKPTLYIYRPDAAGAKRWDTYLLSVLNGAPISRMDITISGSGCVAKYPQIVAIDLYK